MMAKIFTAMPSLIIFVLLALNPVGQITTVRADEVKAGDIYLIEPPLRTQTDCWLQNERRSSSRSVRRTGRKKRVIGSI
jgi:hypothetical protein